MSFWIWLDGGCSLPLTDTWRQRLALWCGRRMALRHDRVTIDPTARISPEARIHPRDGRIYIGPRSTIAPGVILQGNVEIGADCSVQAYSVVVGYGLADAPTGQIRIGDHVRIAPHVQIIAANHRFDDPSRPISQQGLEHAPISIANDVWVAGRVTIVAGVMIGEGAVLVAGAVVTKDVPPAVIVGGVPARVLKAR